MRPVFFNSATVTARENLLQRGGARKPVDLRVRYGVFEHPQAGLVLIDTGYTRETLEAPGRGLLLRLYAKVLGPSLIEGGQPEAALAMLGHTSADVSMVIVTHFHADHVSGLAQFPNARFLCHGGAYGRLVARSALGNQRHGIFTELLPSDFAARMEDVETRPRQSAPLGLPPGRDLFGDGSVLAIDLPGHAEGHFGLVFTGDRPLLYGVDVQWLLSALPAPRRPGFPATLISEDLRAGGRSAELLLAFQKAGGELVLCHDPNPTRYDAEAPA